MRTESDGLGKIVIPDDKLFGIHTVRSIENFPASGELIDPYLIKSYLQVKQAAALTNLSCGTLSEEKNRLIDSAIENLLTDCDKAISGESTDIYKKIKTDPLQGGAGTSLNMNINEVIANSALGLAGKNFGDYSYIHPLDDVNMNQSTNDTFPTALKIASIYRMRELADAFASLQNELQKKENEFRNIIKLGRTQLQDAVPITLGQEFGAFAQAVARDRWRVYNAEERIRSVNLGGTAVGNSVGAPREYVLNVVSNLKKISRLPVAKAEDMIDATQNLDAFVEVHGIIKAGAVSMIKICNDLRLLASGPHGGIGEINLPAVQTGSSIMPGKINPVILESSIQIGELVKGHDLIIANLINSGNLELNAFLPMIAHLFLKSLRLLRDSILNLADRCIGDITANPDTCRSKLIRSTAAAASLIPVFGYDKIQELVKKAAADNTAFIDVLKEANLLTEEKLIEIISNQLGIKIE